MLPFIFFMLQLFATAVHLRVESVDLDQSSTGNELRGGFKSIASYQYPPSSWITGLRISETECSLTSI